MPAAGHVDASIARPKGNRTLHNACARRIQRKAMPAAGHVDARTARPNGNSVLLRLRPPTAMVLNNPSILGRPPGHLERAGGHIVRFEVGRRPRLNKHAENQSTNRKKWGPRSGSPTAPETSPISRVPCGSLLASSRPVAAAEGIACFGFIRQAYCQAQNH